MATAATRPAWVWIGDWLEPEQLQIADALRAAGCPDELHGSAVNYFIISRNVGYSISLVDRDLWSGDTLDGLLTYIQSLKIIRKTG